MERSHTSHSSESVTAHEQETTHHGVEKELAACTKELAEYKDRFLRLNADFENSRRRAAREQLQAEFKIKEHMLKGVLTVADTVERALNHAHSQKDKTDISSWQTSLELIQKELDMYLSSQGVTKIEVKDEFNPELHEAIASVSAPGKLSGTVVDTVRTGYLLNGMVIRPVQVTVAQ